MRHDVRAIATPPRILLAGWLLFLVYAYPGYLSPDPILQLTQARSGVYGSWHPPIMAFEWKILELFISGTFLMLVVQSVTFLVGLYSLLGRAISPRKAAYTAVAILLFPPVMTTMAVIWKDSQMAGFLLCGAACLLANRLRWRLVGCALLCLATAMRYNALGATLPLVVLLFQWREGIRRLARYAIAFAMWIAITFTASQVNNALTDTKEYPWYLGALHDITGIMHWTPVHTDQTMELLLPGVLHVHEHVAEEIDKRYHPWSAYYLAFTDDRVYDYPETDEMRATVRRAWFKLVYREPRAYLHHRFRVAMEILAMTETAVIGPVWDGYEKDANTARFPSIGITMEHSDWQAFWVHSLQSIGQSLLFRAYLYFFVAIALLWPVRRSPLDLALVLSGLMYEGTLFIAAVPDARYSQWMITCTVLAYVRTIVMRARGNGP